MSERKRIRVLLADDHLIVRMGLAALLGLEDDIALVGEATDGEEAVRLAAATHPDIVLMDLMMPKTNGVEATRGILRARPETKVVILTTFLDSPDVRAALEAGACGALIKNTSRTELVAAIRRTLAGEHVYSREIRTLLETTATPPHLSPRQLDILHYAGRGFSNADIATALGVGPDCVKANLKSAFIRLGAATRAEAVALALKAKLLNL